jgi:hypothetical protein
MFDKTDTTLSSFIKQASLDDLTVIASQVFSRVASLDQREQEQFLAQVQKDPEARRLFEAMQTSDRR